MPGLQKITPPLLLNPISETDSFSLGYGRSRRGECCTTESCAALCRENSIRILTGPISLYHHLAFRARVALGGAPHFVHSTGQGQLHIALSMWAGVGWGANLPKEIREGDGGGVAKEVASPMTESLGPTSRAHFLWHPPAAHPETPLVRPRDVPLTSQPCWKVTPLQEITSDINETGTQEQQVPRVTQGAGLSLCLPSLSLSPSSPSHCHCFLIGGEGSNNQPGHQKNSRMRLKANLRRKIMARFMSS